MQFAIWLESRQFRRLIPPEVIALVPALKAKARELTQKYFADKDSVPPQEEFSSLPDGTTVSFIRVDQWRAVTGLNGGQGAAGGGKVYYRIPMTDYDTIYHELVHVYDPKLRNNLSKIALAPNLGQSMTTSHEIDARIGGHVDRMQEMLQNASSAEKNKLISELSAWLKRLKREEDLETPNLPVLLRGMSLFVYWKNPQLWRKFTSILYNDVISKNF